MGKPITTAAGGVCVAFPDVCLTPAPPPPGNSVPVPYPNIGTLSEGNMDNLSGTVKCKRKWVVHSESSIRDSTGDEAGSAHPTTKGKVEFSTASTTVKCDGGKGVVRMFDTTTQNDGNAVGTVLGGEPTVLVGG